MVYVRTELAIIQFCRKKWVHKQCRGVKGSLLKASQSFFCRSCKVDRPITDGLILICIWILYHWKKSINGYLGDTLDADGGCDSAVTARVRSAWKKFRANWKMVLVKIERQGIRYLYEEFW